MCVDETNWSVNYTILYEFLILIWLIFLIACTFKVKLCYGGIFGLNDLLLQKLHQTFKVYFEYLLIG